MTPPLGANNHAQRAIVHWGEEYGFEVDWFEQISLMTPGRLRNYNTVVLLSNTRLFMDDPRRPG